jgi:isoleucyl-tRNA synthetase
MPFSEYHYPFERKEIFESRFPAQFVVEYIAQTRAWFYVMHVISQIVFGRAPFENVLTTGTILAEDGTKMSKSKNNYPDPWLVIDKYGVDTVRFYLANSVVMQADNLNFSMKDMENVHRKVTMLLWNVRQYFVTYSKQGNGAAVGAPAPAHALDRWILARAKELVVGVTDQLDAYDTVRATRAIQDYIDDLSTWYLRRSRGRDDASFFPSFRQALLILAQVLAPFMPHIAEAIYRDLRAESDPISVHLTDWPAKQELDVTEKKLLEDMAVLREVASVALAARKTADVPVRQALAQMSILNLKGEPIALAPELASILLAEVNVKKIAAIAADAAGISKAADEKYVLLLDMNLTDELRLEGTTRALERFIQEMRKTQGFKVGETAALRYDTADPEMEKAIAALDMKKTYLAKVEKAALEDAESFNEGGRLVRLALVRA